MKNFFIFFSVELIFVFSNCKQKETTPATTSTFSQIVAAKDTSIFAQYDAWLSEMNLIKPKKVYLDILRKMYEFEQDTNCKSAMIRGLSEKTDFQKVFSGFKLFPYNENFIFIRGYDCWETWNVGSVYSLIDKRDSIVSFNYDCLTEQTAGGGGRIDSIYINKWGDSYNEVLFVNEMTRCSGLRNNDIHLYNLKTSKNNFLPIFSYTLEGFSKTGMDRVNEKWKDSIRFINPNEIEKTSYKWVIADTIKPEDYNDTFSFKNKIRAQREWLKDEKLNSEKKSFYQFDIKQKKYIETKE